MVNILILSILLSSLCGVVYPKDRVLISKAKLYPSYIKTPQDIEDWFISSGLKYILDKTKKDEWKTPEQTIKDKGGDCEDFARLSAYILEDLGYIDVMLIAIYGKDLAHGICWFRERDKSWSFFSTGYEEDNKHYKLYWASKLKNPFNILYLYYPEWVKVYLCTSEGHGIFKVTREDLEGGLK